MFGRRLFLAAMLVVMGAPGCASGPFALEVRHAGKLDPEKDERVADEAQSLPWDGNYDDIVVTNELPPVVTLEKGALMARSDLFVILGDVRSHMDDTRQVAFAKSVFWYESMHESHGSGRDVFCKVQTPLRTLTLGTSRSSLPRAGRVTSSTRRSSRRTPRFIVASCGARPGRWAETW